MIDWAKLTLLLYMLMRMTGFVMFNPILGRRGIPGLVKAGLTVVLTFFLYTTAGVERAALPANLVEFVLKLLLELGLGYLLGFVIELFFYIPLMAGQIIDTQMGTSMASTYDPGTQVSSTITSTLLNVMMVLLFFAANGHLTLMRILLTSGGVVPFGGVALGPDVADAVAALFIECTLMAVKLSLPILAAELIGEIGMGILIKTIPQVNAFVINIELKVVVGLILVWVMISPFSEFLLSAELDMLQAIRQALSLAV